MPHSTTRAPPSLSGGTDFEALLVGVTRGLADEGMLLDGLEIDVIEGTSRAIFQDTFLKKGFRYTTYALRSDGCVESESYRLTPPFSPVSLGSIERFVEGRPWRGRSEDTATIEIPATAPFARLRFVSKSSIGFTEEDVEMLEQFTEWFPMHMSGGRITRCIRILDLIKV